MLKLSNVPRKFLSKASLLSPWILLGILLASYSMFPWVSATYFGIPHPMWILVSLMVASLAIYSKYSGKRLLAGFHWTVWDTLLLCFVCIVAISLFFSEIEDKERIVRYLFSIMLFPYFFSRTISRDGISVFVYTTLILSFGFIIFTLMGIIDLGDVALRHERVYLYFGFPAHQAFPMGIALLAIFLVSSLMLEKWGNPKKNGIMLAVLFSAVLSITFLGSRAVLVTCLFVSFTIVLLARWKPFKAKLLCLLVVACAVMLALAIVPHEKRWFFGQLMDVNAIPKEVPKEASSKSDGCKIKDNSMAIRTILYREAITAFMQNPLVGVGVGRFGYYSCYYDFGGELHSPHSTALHALVELGLMGGGVFLGLMVGLIVWLLPQMAKEPNADNHWVYIVSPMFLFSVILDQMSASYLTSLHYYLMAGVLVTIREHLILQGSLNLFRGKP